MMKIFPVFILIIISTSVFCQSKYGHNKDSLSYKNEISMNVSSIVFTVFSKGDSSGISPYMVDYSRQIHKNGFLRGSVGGHIKNKKVLVEGFADHVVQENWALDIRAGYLKKIQINRRFGVDFGIDGIVHFSAENEISDSGFDLIESINQTSYVGGGPFFGFRYYLNKRLSLRSESALYIIGGKNQTATLFKNFPQLNDYKQTNKILETRYYLPVNIFLQFSF